MRNHLKRILAVVLTLMLFWPSLPFAESQRSYDYPYENPFRATSTFALLESRYAQRVGTYVELPILPGRKEVPHLEQYRRLGVLYYSQDGAAPLVLVIPGLGGYALDNAPQWLAEHFFERGFHVIVVPSAFNWRFAIAASTTGRPGITRMDALDLLRVMRTTLDYWKREIREPIAEVGLLGYSLGGLQAAFVARAWDPEAMGFSLGRVLLINPPIDLRHAAGELDEFYGMHAVFGPEKARRLENDIAGAARVYVTDHDIEDPGYFENLNKKFEFTPDELKFGIGLLYREVLSNVIFASQQVHDLGILEAPVNPPRFVKRLAEAKRFGFRDYYRQFLLPYTAEDTAEELFDNNSLASIETFIRSNRDLFVMHNQDDILVEDGDLEYLRRVFGHRAIVYPKGGHLGNLWFPENLENIIELFRMRRYENKRAQMQ